MRLALLVAALLVTIHTNAQPLLTPNTNVVEKKWLTNSSYQMDWYAVKDSMRIEVGKTMTTIRVSDAELVVVTRVSLKQNPSPWIDSTIANVQDLSPIYHSSSNAQRAMILNFGRTISGFYTNKLTNSNTTINDTTSQPYFDSNLYPILITWLPLQEGYEQGISLYDYQSSSKSGLVKASIHQVKKGTFKTRKSGIRSVWVVTVSDEISGSENDFSTYYIDRIDRRLWKQQINVGGRIMEMELLEIE